MKILICDPFSKELPGKLKKFGEVTDNKTEISNADIILVRSATKCDCDFIKNAKNLKMIIRGGVGIDNIDTECCKKHGIIVKNTPAASSIAVAELVFSHMLCIQRNIVKSHNTTKNGEWVKKELKGRELYGKTLGIVGLGRIGSEVAKRAEAFGMNVIAYTKIALSTEHAKLVSLEEVLTKSDIITLHIPLFKETEEMINSDMIKRMKDGVIIINTARGKLINETDLAKALKEGKVRYAGLDVYCNEPPADSPLLKADNILLTPHLGANTYENMERIGDIVCELIEEFSKDQKK
ncbi:MAG: hydroxyacid dehydrogenase [Candidatus Aenigmarchaeota archaeon]|nr:hydroxyacid dehydrogenase [Candidatus Aenigmarchaeota archaeon]